MSLGNVLLLGFFLLATCSLNTGHGINMSPMVAHYDAVIDRMDKLVNIEHDTNQDKTHNLENKEHVQDTKQDKTNIPSKEKDLPPAQFTWGGLYPHESTTRERKSLDGVWNFRLSPKGDPDLGFVESWFSGPLTATGDVIAMPVPSSYNDVTQDKDVRDHVGWAWYDTSFYAPPRWQQDGVRVLLRFGSIHYNSIIYVNGAAITSHVGGHLPLMADVTAALVYDGKNLLTVAVNNTLTPETIPQGSIQYHDDEDNYPPGYFVQTYDFDFFNYAGIHRSVFLYATPPTYIDDVTVSTGVIDDVTVSNDVTGDWHKVTGTVTYSVRHVSSSAGIVTCSASLLTADDTPVLTASGCHNTTLTLTNPTLWWPYLMHPNPGYQYTLMVSLKVKGVVVDSYPVKVGIRQLGWSNSSLTINGRPLYIRGCGKHEDADIRGKGYDAALVVKDFSLLKWLGANAFRTSHYPYAEEIMDRADAEGIMVIDECPAVNLRTFDAALQSRHIAVMGELVARDKNRPSVVMWSVANEPRSSEVAAADYFSAVVAATKALDPSRAVTAALNVSPQGDHAAASLDVIFVNRYYSWYGDPGHTELIKRQMVSNIEKWRSLHDKPIGVSEYGADTMPGLHMDPAAMWSEEYQKELYEQNFLAFDELRSKGYFVGEMVWNFADFMTKQGTTRVSGNKKGIFTRARQPKSAAFTLRDRYLGL